MSDRDCSSVRKSSWIRSQHSVRLPAARHACSPRPVRCDTRRAHLPLFRRDGANAWRRLDTCTGGCRGRAIRMRRRLCLAQGAFGWRSRARAGIAARAATPNASRSGRRGWTRRCSRPCRTGRWCSPHGLPSCKHCYWRNRAAAPCLPEQREAADHQRCAVRRRDAVTTRQVLDAEALNEDAPVPVASVSMRTHVFPTLLPLHGPANARTR